jgi:hypothetical protein
VTFLIDRHVLARFVERPLSAGMLCVTSEGGCETAISAGFPVGDDDDETPRLACLHSLSILDTAPEVEFDRITGLALSVFSAGIALVSLVDADRQWFKSSIGLGRPPPSNDTPSSAEKQQDAATSSRPSAPPPPPPQPGLKVRHVKTPLFLNFFADFKP